MKFHSTMALVAVTTLLCTAGASLANHNSVPGVTVFAPSNDPVNFRKWPSTTSMVVATQTNGEYIDLTGRCKNIVTNHSFMLNLSNSQSWNYARMKKPNVWCQVNMFNLHVWVRGRHAKMQ